jgi:hypothetical protein
VFQNFLNVRSQLLILVFDYGTLNANEVLRQIQGQLKRLGYPLRDFVLDGRQVALDQIGNRSFRFKRPAFTLKGPTHEFLLGSVANFGLDFLEVKYDAPQKEWDEWTAAFISNRHFTMAWIADSDYHFWQNVKDIRQYTMRGKPFDHLPLISNDLPPPLEATIIDTSLNPGRWMLKQGHHEVVSSTMWLGETFWRLTGASKKAVEATAWLKVSRPGNSVLRIEAAPRCFISDTGPQGEIQRKLRKLLFPKSASQET